MAIPKLTEDLNIIARLGDKPGTDDGLSNDGFKAKFDEAALKIQQYLNEVLVPEINIAIDIDELVNHIMELALSVDGGFMKGSIDMNGNSITFLADPVNPGDAANRGYVDTKHKDATYILTSVVLSASNWNNKRQTVTVSGVTDNIDLTVAPNPSRSNTKAYNEAEVLCTASGNNTLTFECEFIPDIDIFVNIKYRNLGVDG